MYHFAELATLVETRLQSRKPFPDTPQNLYEPCRYFLQLGGKRIRPALCLMGNELFGDIREDAWHAALGIELFHNFTLIHDDIMDKAPIRRGQKTLHERNGLTAGILCGDVMNILAYDHFVAIRHHLPQVLAHFNKAAIEVCEGQQLDMDFETRDQVTIDEYIQMITLKTSVLVAAALKIGAMLGGATEGTSRKLAAFGRNMGIAFQLLDDYLDAFGIPEQIGKQQGGDIKSNKKTFLLLYALNQGNAAQHAAIRQILASDRPDKVETMLQLYRDTGAEQACRAKANAYSDAAFDCLEDVPVLRQRKEPLFEVAQMLLQRVH